MFTGIVEEVGKIISVNSGGNSAVLTIQGNKIFEGMKLGDSIAVNGVCLTVTEFQRNIFSVDVMKETLARSSLAEVKAGSWVNLERAMPANGRFGGHIVSGHIDGTGKILEIRKEANAIWYKIKTPEKLMRYIIEKGSITIDGISLTVAKLDAGWFQVSIIPHTAKATILSGKKVGDLVNLENDLVGKYIEKFLIEPKASQNEENGITRDMLIKYGF